MWWMSRPRPPAAVNSWMRRHLNRSVEPNQSVNDLKRVSIPGLTALISTSQLPEKRFNEVEEACVLSRLTVVSCRSSRALFLSFSSFGSRLVS